MRYPKLAAVEAADQMQLCRWWRFLPSPGMAAVEAGDPQANASIDAEAAIMDRIAARLKEAGGFTPEISKALGWGDS